MSRVMIVENSEKPCISVKKLLALINYEIVFETSNGYEAIEKYGVLKPDLLLLDITVLQFDVLGVLKEIKKNHPDSKVIIVTLHPDKNLYEECGISGADACITLPYKLKDFVSLVTSLCRSRPVQARVAPVIVD